MKKAFTRKHFLLSALSILLMIAMTACTTTPTETTSTTQAECEHYWISATCQSPMICAKCTQTQGTKDADAHAYMNED
jgi:hypothetical protein